MWRRGADWWELRTVSPVVCAAVPADAPLSPPSGNTPHAGFGAGVATGGTGMAAPAWQPTAEAPAAAPQQRWPPSRSGSGFRQWRFHRAAPECRRLLAEAGPPAPRRHGSGSTPAERIRLRAEPARPLPRQLVSCSVPAAVMRPRCLHPSVAARARRRAGRAGPPPRAPGVPPGRPTTCAGRGATADPSAGAVPVRTPGRWSPSMYSGRAPLCAGCRAVAPPRERRRPAGRRSGGCSCRRPARSTRAGVAGAAAGLTTGRATAPQTDHPGTIPARAKRPAATPMERRPARARARRRRRRRRREMRRWQKLWSTAFVRGRRGGSGNGNGNGNAGGRQKRRVVPVHAALAAARRHAAPRSALPAAQAASPRWFGQRYRDSDPDRGSDPVTDVPAAPVRLGPLGPLGSARSAKVVSNCAAEVILSSPLCSLARTHPYRRHSRMAWMGRCAAASVKRNSRTA